MFHFGLDLVWRGSTSRVFFAYQVGENVILYEANGDFIDDAGFAYLPRGPDRRLSNANFEAPVFKRLGDGWYSWTASW